MEGTCLPIEIGRGQSIPFLLLKFIPGSVQRHSRKFEILPPSDYTASVRRGRGVLCCVGDHLFRTYTLWMGPDSDSTKLLTTPRQQLRRGEGITKINRCRNDLFQVTFKTKRFCIAFYEFYSSSYMFTHIRYRGVGQIDSKKVWYSPFNFSMLSLI